MKSMTTRPTLYFMAAVAMFAAMESCDRSGKALENQKILEQKINAIGQIITAEPSKAVSVELPKLQSEVMSGKTNWFYQFGPRKVYVPGE